MTKFGLKSLDINYIVERDNLKKYFLYFDKIYFDKSGFKMSEMIGEALSQTFFKSLDFKEQIKLKSAEIDYLLDEGLLIEFKNKEIEEEAYKRNYTDFIDFFEEHKKKGSMLFSTVDVMHLASVAKTTQNLIYGTGGNPDDAYQCYFSSTLLGRINEIEITPIFEEFSTNNPENQGRDYEILTFVLNNLPVIDDSTSWEEIIDFKANDDIKLSFQRLRNWMIDISKTTNLSKMEIEEKYEYLYHEYKSHIERNRIKTTKGAVKTMIFTATDTIENLATLKWSKLAKDLFSIFDGNMRLAEIETNAPGKELGFIYKANEKFKK